MDRREFLQFASLGVAQMATDVSIIRPPTGIVNARQMQAPVEAYIDGSPISLIASVTLQANSSDSPNIAALKNPTPHPIEISEIRFHANSDSYALSCAVIGAKFQLGGATAISDAYVPLWLFDQSRQLTFGESFQYAAGRPDFNSEAEYVWRLNTPLLILSGEVFNVSFQHYGLLPDDVQVDVTYGGRVLVGHPLPRTRVVPFVSFWQGNSLDLTFATTDPFPTLDTVETDSTELDLVNSSSSRVTLHKLTGRLVTVNSNESNTSFSDEVQPIIDSMFNVDVRSSKGYEVTQGLVPFRLMFARDTRAFDGHFILDPGDYIIARVVADQGAVAPHVTAGPVNNWPTIVSPVVPQIGLIGERTVGL